MTITKEDVLAMRDALVASDSDLAPAEVVQGVRTLVHEKLQEASPMPYLLPDPEPGRSDAEYGDAVAKAMRTRDATTREAALAKLHHEHIRYRASRVVKAKALVSLDEEIEFESERSAGRTPPGMSNAHHYAQYKHVKKLWEQADAIVAAAGLMPALTAGSK